MPIRYEIKADFIEVVLDGHFGTDDIARTAKAVLEDPARGGLDRVLVDNRPSLEIATYEDVRERVELFRAMEATHFISAIVVDTQVHFGLGRMTEMLGERDGARIRIFRDYDEACRWLRGQAPSER